MPYLHPAQPLTLAILAALLASDEPVRLDPAAGGATAPPPPTAAPAPLAPAAELLLAYAVGTGPELPAPLVRRLLLLQAYYLSQSQLSAAPALARRLLDFFSRDVWPVVPAQGALGLGSNHLPLAHLSLPLLGLGEVDYQGYRLAAADVLGLFGWAPVAVPGPEAPYLLGGSAFTLAYATETLARATPLLQAATAIGALSTAANVPGAAVADAPFGNLPPVPAATHAALASARRALELLLTAPDATAPARAAGGPSSQAPAPAPPPLLGRLALGVAAVGELAAQRLAQLVAGEEPVPGAALRALPLTAASLGAQNQRLSAALPAPAGPPSAADTLQVIANTEQLLGLELLAAAQVLDQRPAAGHPAGAVVAAFRAHVTFVGAGRLLAPDLARAARFVREYAWA
ncbi:MAG: aromatic amino acid lyase [Janthinobacterium lividum]